MLPKNWTCYDKGMVGFLNDRAHVLLNVRGEVDNAMDGKAGMEIRMPWSAGLGNNG